MAVARAPRSAVARPRAGGGILRTVAREFTNPEKRTAYLMVLPSLLVIAAIALYPMVYAIVLSFQHVLATGATTGWVGVSNYTDMFRDSDFQAGIKNTAIF